MVVGRSRPDFLENQRVGPKQYYPPKDERSSSEQNRIDREGEKRKGKCANASSYNRGAQAQQKKDSNSAV